MASTRLLAAALLLTAESFSGRCSPLPDSWDGSLEPGRGLGLSWRRAPGGVLLRARAATAGALAIGLSSPAGAVAVAGVDDVTGRPYLLNCRRRGKTLAATNDRNFQLEGDGLQNETHTVVELRLRLERDACDSAVDKRTVQIVWAMLKEDQKGKECESVMSDGMVWEGPKSVNLVSASGQPQQLAAGPPADVYRWDITLNNFSVPENMDTFYWCKAFKIPPLNRKHHIIGYEPLLGGGGGGGNGWARHMVLYECGGRPPEPASLRLPGAACGSPHMPAAWERCVTPALVWTRGSTGSFLPDHVGLPIADGKMSTYFMLEINYDNPTLMQASVSSGLRIYYTDKLRQNDGAILVSGVVISPLQVIPPAQKKYKTAGYCDFHCTHSTLASEIKVVSALMHAHQAGSEITLRHVRAGIELTPIAQGKVNKDNQFIQLKEETKILPGDELITECVYDTTTRSTPTVGGYSTKQEMCLGFITYYPKSPLASCLSMTPVDFFFETFGVKKFYHYDMSTIERIFLSLSDQSQILKKSASTTPPTFPELSADAAINDAMNEEAISTLKKMPDFSEHESAENNLFDNLIIEEPEEFRNRSFTDHLHRLPWTELLLTQTIENTIYKGKHMTFCRLFNDSLQTPPKTFNFPNFTELPDRPKSSLVCPQRRNHSLPAYTSSACSNLFNIYICFSFVGIYFRFFLLR